MALCWDCSKAEGVVRVGPLVVCAICAEARIRSLEAVAEGRARDWQRERIRAEELADKGARLEAHDLEQLRDIGMAMKCIHRLRAVRTYARAIFEALDGKPLEQVSLGLTWQVEWLGIALEECAKHGDLEGV